MYSAIASRSLARIAPERRAASCGSASLASSFECASSTSVFLWLCASSATSSLWMRPSFWRELRLSFAAFAASSVSSM